MQRWQVRSTLRNAAISACVIGTLVAQAATADCPPGYNSKAGHCIPGPAQPHHPVAIKSLEHAPTAVSPTHAGMHHAEAASAWRAPHHADPAHAGSSAKYDLRAQHEAKSDTHGIIFVGGKSALNPQPIPPGKNALNPQPIPPGHAARKPQPGAPIEKTIGH